MTEYLVGLDLGQSIDFTALAVAEILHVDDRRAGGRAGRYRPGAQWFGCPDHPPEGPQALPGPPPG